MSLRENCANTSTRSITLHDKFPFRIGVMQDGSRGESFLEVLEGRNGCLCPYETLFPLLEHRCHGHHNCAEASDESPVKYLAVGSCSKAAGTSSRG